MGMRCSGWYFRVGAYLLGQLQRVQNAAAQLIARTKKQGHITPKLVKLHWLPIKQRIQYKLLLLAYRVIHRHGPSSLAELLRPREPEYPDCALEGIFMVQERHSYNTRNSVLSLVLPRVNSSGEKSFSYIAAKYWNQVPIPIRTTANPLHF